MSIRHFVFLIISLTVLSGLFFWNWEFNFRYICLFFTMTLGGIIVSVCELYIAHTMAEKRNDAIKSRLAIYDFYHTLETHGLWDAYNGVLQKRQSANAMVQAYEIYLKSQRKNRKHSEGRKISAKDFQKAFEDNTVERLIDAVDIDERNKRSMTRIIKSASESSCAYEERLLYLRGETLGKSTNQRVKNIVALLANALSPLASFLPAIVNGSDSRIVLLIVIEWIVVVVFELLFIFSDSKLIAEGIVQEKQRLTAIDKIIRGGKDEDLKRSMAQWEYYLVDSEYEIEA